MALAVAEEAKPEAKASTSAAKPAADTKKDKRGLFGLGYGAGWNSGISSYSLGSGLYDSGSILGESVHSVHTITKEVPVAYPQPIAVPVERHIAVPVKVITNLKNFRFLKLINEEIDTLHAILITPITYARYFNFRL